MRRIAVYVRHADGSETVLIEAPLADAIVAISPAVYVAGPGGTPLELRAAVFQDDAPDDYRSALPAAPRSDCDVTDHRA